MNMVIKSVLMISLLLFSAECSFSQEAAWEELNKETSKLFQQGKYVEAIEAAKNALNTAEKTFGPEHYNTAVSLTYLAQLHSNQKKYSEAEPLFKRALSIAEKVFNPRQPSMVKTEDGFKVVSLDLPEFFFNLGACYQSQGKYSEAEFSYKKAISIDTTNAWIPMGLLAGMYNSQHKYAEAEGMYKQALTRSQAGSPGTAAILHDFLQMYRDSGRFTESDPLDKQIIAVIKETFGPDYPDELVILENMTELYKRIGKHSEAQTLENYVKAARLSSSEQKDLIPLEVNDLRLAGIMFNEDNPVAIIENKKTKESKIFKKGDVIGNKIKIEEIKKDKVVVNDGGRRVDLSPNN